MPQRNYLVSTTALSLTQSGTTINSGNTQSSTFVVALTLVRTGISANELADQSASWKIHYVVSAMATPYEMRLKLQRLNSSGVMQTESSYGTTRSATGTYDDDITWAAGTWAANDQLALVWEHRRPSGTGNKSGTVDANGSSYVDAALPPTIVTPGIATLATSLFAAKFVLGVIPAIRALSLATFIPSLKTDIVPGVVSLTTSSLNPSLSTGVVPTTQSLATATFGPSIGLSVKPGSLSLSISTFAPGVPARLLWLDPGGDAVQADGYFGVAQGTGTVSFDTAQKKVGVGSWKFDSGAGNGNPYRKAAGILPPAGRIGFYVRYDEVPNTNAQFTSTGAETSTAYSGGGFSNPSGLEGINPDEGEVATATPAKNSAQGSKLEGFFGLFPFEDQGYIIDSIKIIYERSYDTTSSIGTSRIRWEVDGVEGPNHDDTNMPTTPTVVEVDVTSDRTWTPADVNAMKVIAEALRGDTDTVHTQSWDYVIVRIDYHYSIPVLIGQTGAGQVVLRSDVLPSGPGVVLRLVDTDGATQFFFDGITVLVPNQWHRVAISYIVNAANDMDIKLFVNGVEELWLDVRPTSGQTTLPDFLYGWISNPSADNVLWIDQIYVDDIDDLTDPGPIHMTAKLPASVNANNFDTTGGTGAVDERPVSLTNYKQQAGSQVLQNYTLQADSVGDIDISNETYIGHMGWAVAKKGSGTGSGEGLTVNGDTMGVSLTTSAALVKAGVFNTNYPSNAAGIGMRSIDGDADTFIYEVGVIEAYQGPPEDILFARYLLLAESSAEVIDDLRASPPSSYLLRYWIWEGGGSVTITAYSITAEGESPRVWPIISNAAGGSGLARIGVPGIEVRVVIQVADADTYVMLQGYPNL